MRRGGDYLRVADPAWADPLDGRFSARRGGRWNPPGYPRNEAGDVVGWARCQPIGVDAWEAGLPGVACRSAAPTAPPGGEELAWFQRGRRRLRARAVRRFDDWFW